MSLDDIEHGLLRAKPGYFEAGSVAFTQTLVTHDCAYAKRQTNK